MRLATLFAGIVLLLVGLACRAGDSAGVDEDCPCLERRAGHREIPVPLLLQEAGERMEWVCETHREVVCVDYDSEPCPWCVIPCQLACGACLAIPNYRLAAACLAACIAGCAAECPECEYCAKYEIEETVICGWVLTE